jgi:amidohydrolase
VTAVIRGAHPGPVLMLRADMDALPIQEENDVPYRSQNDGVMHACGHDAHMAMLLIAARVLSENADSLMGTVKLVFQPNEEVAGAEKMVEEGIMENPRPNAALALHIWTPLPSGTVGITEGGVMATMDVFTVTVKGKGGHTGYPESAVDPIVTASEVVQAVQTIQTREISLQKPTVIMFGKIAGGSKNNIIPDQVELEGTMRYLYPGGPDSEENPPERLRRIVKGVCDAHRCEGIVEVERENQAVENDPRMVDLVRDSAIYVLEDERKIVKHASMAGEDFSAFSSRIPSAFVHLGTGNAKKESDYPHHNPRFDIDEDTMPAGVELIVRSAWRFFEYWKEGG